MAFDNRVPAGHRRHRADPRTTKDVSKRLVEYVGQSGFGLVETLAKRCAAIILDEFGVARVRLKLKQAGRGARRARGRRGSSAAAPDGRAYLSLGSNLGSRGAHLRDAVAACARFGEVQVSARTASPSGQLRRRRFPQRRSRHRQRPRPFALNDWLHALEDAHGRDRSGPRYGDRTLDIDIVFYDALVLDGPGHLRLPRDELRHAFVLKPLAEIAPASSTRSAVAAWMRCGAHPDHDVGFAPVAI